MVAYKFLRVNRRIRDMERAVLPALMYAGKTEFEDGYRISVKALTFGWWDWGIGVMRTSVTKQ
jgi:hypothetical protein